MVQTVAHRGICWCSINTLRPHTHTEPYRRSSTTHYDEEHGEGDMELDTSTQETAGGWMEVQPTSQKAAEPQVTISQKILSLGGVSKQLSKFNSFGVSVGASLSEPHTSEPNGGIFIYQRVGRLSM